VYSVGATLYEAITGRPPFVSSNYADLIRQIRTTRPEPIRALLPAIPDAVERAIAKMMAADPEARFQTATAAGRALSEAYTQLLNAATQEIVLPPPATEELSLDALSSDAHPLGPDTDDVTLRFE
jgi:serine/threonine protein kinase